MKRNILLTLVLGAFLVPIAGMDGCGPEGGSPCEGEADCGVEEHCHPTLLVCVTNCMKVDGACDEEPGTSCSEADIIDPIDGMSFNGICVCEPGGSDCPDGEACNPWDRICDVPCTSDDDCSVYPSDQNRTCREDSGSGEKFCLLSPDDCRVENNCDPQVCDTSTGSCIDRCTATSCTGGQFCDDASGLCKDWCDNDNCLDPGEQLCDFDDGSSTFNTCVEPDDATNTCGASGSRSGGPIMYVDDPADVEQITDTNDDPGQCVTNQRNLMLVTMTTTGGLSSTPYEDTAWWDSSWSVGDTYYVGTSSDYLLIYMCFQSTGAQTRAFYHDGTGGESNRVCVDYDIN
jgi:hypothetical protein